MLLNHAQAGERCTTYNFEACQTHSYFVDRCASWVHNTVRFDCQELAAKYFDRLHDASKKGDRSKFDELVQKIFKEIDDAHDAGKIGKGTAGKHKQDVLEQLDDLYKRNSLPVGLFPNRGLTFAELDAAVRKGSEAYKGSTRLGHAFSKHAQRDPHIWGRFAGSPKVLHQKALQHFREVYRAPGSFQRVTDPRTGITWLEKRLSDGRGIRLNLDGTFNGFVD